MALNLFKLRSSLLHLGNSMPLLNAECAKNALHTSAVCQKIQAGRYKKSPKGDKPLTYEMAMRPESIAHTKSWNSWNTSNLVGGLRPAETAVEDVFIRRFVTGTWHNLFLSEIIIKRQHNMIRVAGIISRSLPPRKMYFLIGYTEELLSYWLQCPIKLELQTVSDRKDVVYKYV
ncbi:28S ribosomal protein S24, mitochondrial-like [Macrosteles quadrilineatus]|uniref:28S ribosomal protein S24, mitochondrial-like n=1 Tax=Macrosteles quadrilineatus TaxID=74068 RepID=UPI0023E21458|nr:28S ribosomal protein S24, mitochondrial-like [Macrosteles quadrilineatus]XP_054268392.1 28S ribosomal protein S24, mitochondrial-like [Macrosteles quadrilineatus]